MHATLSPLAAKALRAASEVCSGSLASASIPPAARKFLIQLSRDVCAARLPRQARNTLGRRPVLPWYES